MEYKKETTTKYKYKISNKEFLEKLGLKGNTDYISVITLNDKQIMIETEEEVTQNGNN